jgi:hypothetical protein
MSSYIRSSIVLINPNDAAETQKKARSARWKCRLLHPHLLWIWQWVKRPHGSDGDHDG